jgi:hypothetical protein
MTHYDQLRSNFRAIIDTLEKIDSSYLAADKPNINTPEDLADGYRNALHIVSRAVDFFLELNPERPEFRRLVHAHSKTQGDCPDTVYYHTRVAPNARLKIRGKRCGEAYLSFTLHNSQDRVWSDGIDSEINHHQIETNAEGDYEIIISPEQPDCGNWLRSTALSDQLVVRQYFELPEPAAAKRSLEQFRPDIEFTEQGAADSSSRPTQFNEALRLMDAYIRVMTFEKINIGSNHPTWFSYTPNELGPLEKWTSEFSGGNGPTDVAYSAGYYQLKPGETLRIRGRLPDCDYAGVVLYNGFLQSLDYTERRISLNRSNLNLQSDGSFEVYVGSTDPGLGPWLDTSGRESGIVYWRVMNPVTDSFDPLVCEVVSKTNG